MISVKIDGIDDLVKKYGNGIKPAIKKGVAALAVEAESRIKPYAPATAGNSPKAYQPGRWNTWYQRGWGKKWVTAKGKIKGKRTSETLGRKWQHEPKGELGAVIKNTARYAGYVHGEDQTRVHKSHGWKSSKVIVEQIVKDGTVDKLISKYIAEVIK